MTLSPPQAGWSLLSGQQKVVAFEEIAVVRVISSTWKWPWSENSVAREGQVSSMLAGNVSAETQ